MVYDYIITKPPLDEDTLAHYGVKGMKWRRVKNKIKNSLPGASKRRMKQYNAQKMADDVMTGRRNKANGVGTTNDIWNSEYSDKSNKQAGRSVWTNTSNGNKHTTSSQFTRALAEARRRKNKRHDN